MLEILKNFCEIFSSHVRSLMSKNLKGKLEFQIDTKNSCPIGCHVMDYDWLRAPSNQKHLKTFLSWKFKSNVRAQNFLCANSAFVHFITSF